MGKGTKRALAWVLTALALAAGGAAPGAAAEAAGFAPTDPAPEGDRASVTWSNGHQAWMIVRARPDLTLQILPTGAGKRVKVPWADVRVLRLEPEKEGMEEVWRWKEGGNDEKIKTGESYPWRQYTVFVATADGREIKGRLAAGFALTATSEGATEQLVVSPRHKGENGQTLADLVYVKEITLVATPPAP